MQGLGKTIQTIALLALLAEKKGNTGPHLVLAPKVLHLLYAHNISLNVLVCLNPAFAWCSTLQACVHAMHTPILSERLMRLKIHLLECTL